MRRYSQQHGFTLVELMLVCTLSLIIFGATLTAFTSLVRANRQEEHQRDNVEMARQTIDHAARQLRNLANPTYNATNTIDRAEATDFIFQTSDPAKTWVRYCLQTSGGGATPEDARLWEAESPGSTLTAAMKGTCPGSGWTTTPPRIVAQHVTNQSSGAGRDVFTYQCSPSQPVTCPATAAELPKVTSVRFDLFVDADRTDLVREMQVSTAVFLRNQNEAPTARVAPPTYTGIRKILLNASASSDPEGRSLEYFWFKNAPPAASELADCTAKPPSAIWEGVLLSHQFPAADGPAGTTKQFWLVVRDPGCLIDTTTVSVVIP
jgi:prepilin-type N-terminal cleavage/methylation domain-containing protein